MAKLIWIVPGAALGGAGAILAAMAWPMLGLEEQTVAITIAAIAVGLVLFYAIAFGAAALVEASDLAAANRRLAELTREAHSGLPVEPVSLYEALSSSWLCSFAIGYVSSLRSLGPEQRYAGPDPAQAFPVAALIEDRLMAGLFCRFAEVFIALALISLLLGGAEIVAHGLGSVTVMAEMQAVLVATSLCLVGGAVVWLTQPALLGVCHAQVRRFLLQLRTLFATDETSDQARRVAENVAQLQAQLGRVLERVDAALARDADATARLVDRQAEILASSFDRVVRELEGSLAGAIDRAFGSFSAALDREFGGVERHGALAAEARDAFLGVAERLEQLSQQLAGQAREHADAAGGTAERVLEGFEEGLSRLGDSVFGQATGELRAAAASMRHLYESVDALCLSVAPVLNRLVDTQDALLSNLSQESDLVQLMADVTAELKQLSKTERETVERHVQLASELARVSLNLGQGAGGRAAEHANGHGASNGSLRPALASDPVRSSAAAHDIINALRELRSAADEAERQLPRLEAEGAN